MRDAVLNLLGTFRSYQIRAHLGFGAAVCHPSIADEEVGFFNSGSVQDPRHGNRPGSGGGAAQTWPST